MTTTTMKSFAHSTGKSANQKSGSFTGALMGKLTDGLDALEAMKALAIGQYNRFMELAIQAAHVTKQKLEAAKTIPFASQENDFNAAINPARAMAPKTLGLGTSARKKRKRSDE